jgi:gluconolactonase
MLFCDGLSVPEGPVVLKDGSWLVVEMGPDRGCITHISKDGKEKRIVAKTGRPNGLAVDRNGMIWAAESQKPSLLKVTLGGEVETVLTACGAEKFLFPNDLAFGPDGMLYLTDSGILFEDFAPGGKVRPDYLDAAIDGRVYKINPQTHEVEKIDSGIQFTNGIAFGPDDNLYVNETLTGMIYKYEWQNGNVIGGRQEFGNVIAPDAPAGIKGPDGMKFGADGRLYVTVFAQGDVTILDAGGKVSDRIKTNGALPTNLAFGLPGDKRIYVTEDEHGTLEVFDVGVDGFKLYG